MAGVAGSREWRRSQTLEVTGEGGRRVKVFWYAGTETDEAWVNELSCAATGWISMSVEAGQESAAPPGRKLDNRRRGWGGFNK